MTIEQQAAKVRKVKRAESGMIIDPLLCRLPQKWQMLKCHERIYGGIPIIDEEQIKRNRNQ
jgi:IMP dehydrogenase